MKITESSGKTIFVAISCIGNDTELIRTVKSCIENASFPERIHVGVNLVYGRSVSENPQYIYAIEEKLSNFSRVRYVVNRTKRPLSIARDRNNASDLYSQQDYILQVDSHCYFTGGWDEELISAHQSAIAISGNEKTLITATLPMYTLNENAIEDIAVPENVSFGYGFWENFFIEVENNQKNRIPSWRHTGPEMLSWQLEKMVQSTGFAPAPKITGSFIFGNRYFADAIKMPEHIIFWEEEIIHSIELLSSGFTLVYPYMLANIYHYYQLDETNTGRGARAGLSEIIISSVEDGVEDVEFSLNSDEIEEYAIEWRRMVNESFSSYLDNPANAEKIKQYEKYSGINFKTGIAKFEFPKYYANIGKYPIGEGAK